MEDKKQKAFKAKTSGVKAKKKKDKKAAKTGNDDKHNAKAFTFSGGKLSVARRVQRTLELKEKKERKEIIDKVSVHDAPPFVVVVQGPPGVGKTTLIRSLTKHYSKQSLGAKVEGPVTMVAGRLRRLTFIECSNDMRHMLDLAKVADLVLLLCDASYGFELETFEFLNVLQAHGFPRVMGVLTHLDKFKENKSIRRARKKFKHRFWTEIYDGAKVFYLSGLDGNRYNRTEVMNLARFISVTKFVPLTWRSSHPYMLGLHWEDKTVNPDADERDLSIYGYVNGCRMREGAAVHLPGVGDFTIDRCEAVLDPCPSAQVLERQRRDAQAKDFAKSKGALLRSLSDRHRSLYAPGCDGQGATVDAEAMYINLRDHVRGFTEKKDLIGAEDEQKASEGGEESGDSASEASAESEGDPDEAIGMVRTLQKAKGVMDRQMEASDGFEIIDGRKRRPALVLDDGDEEAADEELQFASDDEEAGLGDDGDAEDDDADEEGDGADDAGEAAAASGDEGESDDENTNTFVSRALKKWSAPGPSLEERVYAAEPFSLPEKVAPIETEPNRLELFSDDSDDEDAEGAGEEAADICAVESAKWRLPVPEADEVEEFLAQLRCRKFYMMRTIEQELTEPADLETAREEAAAAKEKAMLDPNRPAAAEEEETAAPPAKTDAEGEVLDDGTSVPIGAYCRVLLRGVPRECVEQLDYSRPLVVGGVLAGEAAIAETQMKVKRHRWHKKILKTRDALLFSVGWRRFQSLPVFCMEDRNNVRVRMLKYTPEHLHCMASVYGASAPPGTGVLAVRTWQPDVAGFRVALTGQVLEASQRFNVVKKLKLVGEPLKIHKNTAFVTGMFNTDQEASKCIGAKIQTVSGIRGEIKKPHGDRGDFRAAFEDRVLRSDLVVLKAWVPVDLPEVYNPMIDVEGWRRIRSVAELRYDMQVPAPHKKDSEYGQARQERPETRKFPELRVPASLKRELPMALRHTREQTSARNTREHLGWTKQTVAVVRNKRERDTARLLHQLNVVRKEREVKRKAANEKRKATKAKREEFVQGKRDARTKERKKRQYALDGNKEKNKQKKMRLNLD